MSKRRRYIGEDGLEIAYKVMLRQKKKHIENCEVSWMLVHSDQEYKDITNWLKEEKISYVADVLKNGAIKLDFC